MGRSSAELTWREELVKRFRIPAECKELILAVFEEEQWTGRIDDPLEWVPDRDSRQRLHNAVRRLN